MSPLPDDLQKLADAIDAADSRADALAARVTDDDFFWFPGEGRWSIALCLDHLAVANSVYGMALRAAVDRARDKGLLRRGPVMPGFFGRKFVEWLEPPAKRRTRAPRKIRPRPAASRAEILQAYHRAHDDVRRLIAEGATVDLNRATFTNPFIRFVKVRVSTGLNVIAAHDRRHLWQAEQVEREIRASLT
jgi:hypothetical protein